MSNEVANTPSDYVMSLAHELAPPISAESHQTNLNQQDERPDGHVYLNIMVDYGENNVLQHIGMYANYAYYGFDVASQTLQYASPSVGTKIDKAGEVNHGYSVKELTMYMVIAAALKNRNNKRDGT